MTGLGEEVSPDRSAALDALTAESERLRLLDHEQGGDDVEMMKIDAMRAVQAAFAESGGVPISAMKIARAALESLGVPLSVLAALRAGTWRAVPEEPTREQIDAMCDAPLHPTVFPMYRAALKAAPKTPEE